MRFPISLVSVLVTLVIAIPAHASPPHQITVAGLFDLTGGGAIWGKTERNAFILACKDFEANNPGTSVKPLIEDTMFSSKQTVTALHKVTSINKVRYVVGATWETTVPMLPICEAKHVVCISPSYHGKEYYAREHKYSFTAWFDDRGYTTALVKQMNEKGYKKVAIFAAITPYYDSLVENFVAQSKAGVVTQERMILDERDFRSMIAKVPANVDSILMLLDNAGQIQAFLKQWAELRKDRPDIYTDDLIAYLDPPDDVKRYGFVYYHSYPIFDESLIQNFTSRYSKEFKSEPEGSSAAVTYDETMMLLACIKRDPDVEAVRDCISHTTAYKGYSGTFSFNGGQTVTDRVIGVKRY
jgi:ABC-type branched-subunit amino acid transport system substrate-binding protein